MAQRYYSNNAVETTITASVSSGATTVTVAATTGFPTSYPWGATIDFGATGHEVVNVTAAAGASLTIERGQDGTTAVAHASGATFVHGGSARDLSEPNSHIQASADVHGIGASSSVVGSATSQTLTNKTISGASNTLTNLPAAQVTGTFSSVTASGTVTGNAVVSTTSVTGATGTFSGAVTTGSLASSGAVSGTTITGSGAVSGTTLTGSSTVTGTNLVPTGLTGATGVSRYVGATASGAPVSGTFAIGDFVIDRTGKIFVCTTSGSPGTWTNVGSLYLPLAGGTLTGGLTGTTATFTGDTVVEGHNVADELTTLDSRVDALDTDSGQVAVTAGAGWSSAGGYCTVRKLGKTVMLRWSLERTGATLGVNANSTLFTLDAAYRPAVILQTAVEANSSTAEEGMVNVNTDGTVVIDNHDGIALGQGTIGYISYLVA